MIKSVKEDGTYFGSLVGMFRDLLQFRYEQLNGLKCLVTDRLFRVARGQGQGRNDLGGDVVERVVIVRGGQRQHARLARRGKGVAEGATEGRDQHLTRTISCMNLASYVNRERSPGRRR